MLHAWEPVFEITGPIGAQLIGLLFVVVTIGTSLSPSRALSAIHAFVTPTVVNFSSVLFQAIVALSPWPSDGPPGVLLALIGLAGLAYGIFAMGRRRRATRLHGMDWMAHNGAPLVANIVLVCGGVGLMFKSEFAPYAIAGGSTLLLTAGLYGAWEVALWALQSRGP